MNQEDLKVRLMAEAEAAIDAMLARKPAAKDITLSEIEHLVIRSGQEFREAMLEHLVQASRRDETDETMNCPDCGKRLHYKGKRAKTIITEVGEVRIERDYYYCAACQRGVFPPG